MRRQTEVRLELGCVLLTSRLGLGGLHVLAARFGGWRGRRGCGVSAALTSRPPP